MRIEMKSSSIGSWLSGASLGRGSSSLVSFAVALPHGFPFALKSALSPSSSSSLSLSNELRILLPLSSPFVLRCYGAHFAPSDPCNPRHLFLELMEGGSLSSLLKRLGGRLDEPLARHYARSIVQGIEYLHSERIVHCDIKCHNILIGSSGVKIADFGAAKRMGADHEQGSNFRGTPLWMAPEVARGVEQGYASDIWSVGCTVVELLQGRPPLGCISDTASALYKLACSEKDVPLPERISSEARDFLHHCLQRDPNARWTASQLLQHPFLCNIPVVNEPKYNQLSPRSTLNFVQSDASNSDDGFDSIKLPTLGPQSAAEVKVKLVPTSALSVKRQFADAFNDLNEQKWITVKRSASCCKEVKHIPFMKSDYEHVTRGCDINLEAAEFLRNRGIVG